VKIKEKRKQKGKSKKKKKQNARRKSDKACQHFPKKYSHSKKYYLTKRTKMWIII